ncbi:MAG: site-specific integrase [Pseudonocardia sp.]|nr:site-specific integrase [Pseudonocardia sp.]
MVLPYRLMDPAGREVHAVSAYFRDLQATDASASTLRSYGMDILRWLRFCWATGVDWDRASRCEARDFSRWLRLSGNRPRPHWRRPEQAPTGDGLGEAYASSVRAHSETVLRRFYEFHREHGTGPVINPFPLAYARKARRAHAHHNPMDSFEPERVGRYRPTVPQRVPRSLSDEEFNQIFAELPSHRDRALVAFYVSTGARAAELLSVTQGGVDPGRGVIAVTRKGTRAVQELPASSDAFVWLRLSQIGMGDDVPMGRSQPLWWTLRRPRRPLTYAAVHRMFERVNTRAGTHSTLHALRHTAGCRMIEDRSLPITDVQWVLGHASLKTTQLYLTPRQEQVIQRVLAHHEEQTRRTAQQLAGDADPVAPEYRAETLDVLFAGNR